MLPSVTPRARSAKYGIAQMLLSHLLEICDADAERMSAFFQHDLTTNSKLVEEAYITLLTTAEHLFTKLNKPSSFLIQR
jgi:hypothetical protein